MSSTLTSLWERAFLGEQPSYDERPSHPRLHHVVKGVLRRLPKPRLQEALYRRRILCRYLRKFLHRAAADKEQLEPLTPLYQLPYFTQALLRNKDKLPLNIQSITIGDGIIGNIAAHTTAMVSTYLHQQAKALTIPHDILDAFKDADHQCGFDKVFQQLGYPPKSIAHIPGNPEGENFRRAILTERQDSCFNKNPNTPPLINESINAACYGGCATWLTADNYLSHKQPW